MIIVLLHQHICSRIEKWSSTKDRRMVRSRKSLPGITRWSYHLPDWTSFDTQIDRQNWNMPIASTTATREVTSAALGPATLVTYCTRNSWNHVVAGASAVPLVAAITKPGKHRPPRRQALTRASLGPYLNEGPHRGAAYRAPLPPGGLGSASRPPGASPSQSAARASLRSR